MDAMAWQAQETEEEQMLSGIADGGVRWRQRQRRTENSQQQQVWTPGAHPAHVSAVEPRSCDRVEVPPSSCPPEPNPANGAESAAHDLQAAEEADPRKGFAAGALGT